MDGCFHVYILEKPTGRLNVGHTDDLSARLENHNRDGPTLGKFTRKNGPWKLVWSELHATRSSAMLREREIKSWKSARSIRERLLGHPPR
jgi:putative endonuclease